MKTQERGEGEVWGALPLGEVCRICERPVEREDGWCYVRLRNNLIVQACIGCWMKWPDEWKYGLS